jgi:putative ABC transport system permease protein
VTSWLTALRIARREARRAKGRSTLVIAMIALPVLALAFAAASYDMFRLRPDEKADREMGAADARLLWVSSEAVVQDPGGNGWSGGAQFTEPRTERDVLAALPAGSRVIPTVESFADFRTASGIGSLGTRGLDIREPLTAGLVTLLDGRAPASDGEVAISPAAADRLGAGLGDTIQNPDRTRSWTVTGIVEFPGSLFEHVVFLPGAMPDAPNSSNGSVEWLWDAPGPVGWEQVKQLNQRGMVVFSREVFAHPPTASEVEMSESSGVDAEAIGVGGLVAGLAILEIVLLAGPAFAVGARRRRRDLGLIAANGGTPAHLRRIVLADGIVLGTLGAATGLVIGLATALATRPLLEEHLVNQRAGGYRVFPLALAAIVTLAVGTGVLAALVPAFTAARGDVVAALTGRRGSVRSRKRWLVAGAALAAVGAAVTFFGAWRTDINVLLAGLILGELGLVLCTPALVGLIARLGRILPLAPRIALRDTARNRAASAPAIAAVMAAVAGSVALGIVFKADQERIAAEYRLGLPEGNAVIQYQADYGAGAERKEPPGAPDLDRLAALARNTLPAVSTVPVAEVACPPGTSADVYCGLSVRLPADRECPWANDEGPLSADDQRKARRDPRCELDSSWSSIGFGGLIATPDALPGLTGATGDDLSRARAVLAAGGVVLSDPRYIVDGKVTLEIYDARQKEGTTTREDRQRIPTIVVPGYAVATGLPPHGAAFVSSGAVAAAKLTERPAGVVVTNSRKPTTAERDRLTAGLREIDETLYASVELGPDSEFDPTLLILAAAAGLITLGAAGIATGLAAADGRADLSTLAAVGASPGVRRRLSLSQSGVIAGLGTVLGVAAGLGVSAAVLFAYNQAGADRWPVESQYPVGVPWSSLAVVAVVPLVAMLGAGLLTRSRLPIEARRAT